MNSIRDFVKSNITDDMSNYDISSMIDCYISELRNMRDNYTENHYDEWKKTVKDGIHQFFVDVDKLRTSDKSYLRQTFGCIRQTDCFNGLYSLLYKSKSYHMKEKDKAIWAMCAKIYCYMNMDLDDMPNISFASALGDMIETETGLNKFENLLSSSTYKFEYFFTDIIQFVTQLKSSSKTFNCEDLLFDLLLWENTKKSVQQRWARDFYNKYENKKSDK